MKMLILALALIPFAAHAEIVGTYEGNGTCYVENYDDSACTINIKVTKEVILDTNVISFFRCSWDIESPVKSCFNDTYRILNGNELWIDSPQLGGMTKIGSITEEKIALEIPYPDLMTTESYEFSADGMKYSSNYHNGEYSMFNESGFLKRLITAAEKAPLHQKLAPSSANRQRR